MPYPSVTITQEMLDAALQLLPATRVHRTMASPIDTLTGNLGEFVFAAYRFGDWRKHRVGANKGQTDFDDFEIKTSAFPFSEKLHLLVREDYAAKRKPKYYVQIIIHVEHRKAEQIPVGSLAFLCGYATATEVDCAPLKDFGSKTGELGGYCCHYIPILQLHPLSALPTDC